MDDLPPGLVVVPAQSQMWTKSALAIMRLQAATPRADVFCVVDPTTIAHKRNWGVASLLKQDRYRWMLCLDSDMTPPEDAITRLWATAEETGADLVQAAMVGTRPPYVPTGGVLTNRGEPDDPLRPYTSDPDLSHTQATADSLLHAEKPVEVDYAGTGCLLVRRRVFEALEEPWFVARDDGAQSDYNFTLRATDAGFKAVLEPRLWVGHLATYAFGLEEAAAASRTREKRRRAAGMAGGGR